LAVIFLLMPLMTADWLDRISTWPETTEVISVASSSKRTISAPLALAVMSWSLVVARVTPMRLPSRSA